MIFVTFAVIIVQVYQLLLHHTGHRDHNVVTVTLEALLQILRTPPPDFKAILTTSGSITETYIYKNDMPGLTAGTNCKFNTVDPFYNDSICSQTF